MLRKVYETVKAYKTSAIRSSADHNYFNVFIKSETDIGRMLPISLKDAIDLIIGCGYRYAIVKAKDIGECL